MYGMTDLWSHNYQIVMDAFINDQFSYSLCSTMRENSAITPGLDFQWFLNVHCTLKSQVVWVSVIETVFKRINLEIVGFFVGVNPRGVYIFHKWRGWSEDFWRVWNFLLSEFLVRKIWQVFGGWLDLRKEIFKGFFGYSKLFEDSQ